MSRVVKVGAQTKTRTRQIRTATSSHSLNPAAKAFPNSRMLTLTLSFKNHAVVFCGSCDL